MTKVMIKHRLFTWFEEGESPAQPGVSAYTERIAHLGDVIDIPSDNPHLARGKELDAFFTDAERKQIEEGKYRGPGSEQVYQRLNGIKPTSNVEALDDEGPQVEHLSEEELGEYIKENGLKVDETVALAGDSLESIERVLDAENIATDNSPRKGVTDALEAKMKALASQ